MDKIELSNENSVVKSIIGLLRTGARAHSRTDTAEVFFIKITRFYWISGTEKDKDTYRKQCLALLKVEIIESSARK